MTYARTPIHYANYSGGCGGYRPGTCCGRYVAGKGIHYNYGDWPS
ncbi:hypothetical protein [Rudanella paleaurantiibacter]|nr:hypothetical protein [Rudanella paleaurantiibacter]